MPTGDEVSTTTINDIAERSDKASVWADLATFFGPNAEAYLHVYDQMRVRSSDWVLSWSWAGFFIPHVWLCYRKQYLLTVLSIAIPAVLILAFDLDHVAVGGGLVITLWGKSWYVQAGLKRVAKADALGLAGAERIDYLRRAGGVSLVAAGIVACLYGVLLVSAIEAAFGPSPVFSDGGRKPFTIPSNPQRR